MYDKICWVCSDRAVGYNFSALSCESCRLFFRRNVKRVLEFKCLFGNKCEINCTTRKFCKKCRIDKCFEVGMKKESIVSENDIKVKKCRKRCLVINETLDFTSDSSLDMNLTVVQKSVANHSVVNIPALIRGLIFGLNETEMSQFKELFSSATHMREPKIRITSKTLDFFQSLKVLQNRCDIKCRRVVKMSSNINGFTNLCEDDKVVLLKTSCPEIICLISVTNFNFEGEYWTVSTSEEMGTTLHLDMFRCVKGMPSLYDAQKRFLLSMQEEWDSDFNIIDLMTAILLFNPNHPNLIHKEMVHERHENYIHLLQRYLELKHNSKSESEYRFVRLMNAIQELYALNRLHVLKFSEHGFIKQAGPLVEEIFEVQSQNALKNQ